MTNIKYLWLVALGLVFLFPSFAEEDESPKQNAVTIGLLQGGGGLVGLDYERLIAGGLGVQVGVGFVSFGGGLTYHFEETTHSNAVWVGLWNQGAPGSDLSATYLGVSYIMRGWHWLSGQIGISYIPFRGKEAEKSLKAVTGETPPPFALLYSLGYYSGF